MENKKINVLLIEDDPAHARSIREMLAEAKGVPFELESADRLAKGLARLATGGIHSLLLDLSLPDSHGLDTLAHVQGSAKEAAIIVLTGLEDEVLAMRTLRGGAQDCLVKGQVDGRSLVRAIRYSVERRRLFTELQKNQEEQIHIKDRFLSHVSREFRTPLTTIYAFTTILLAGLAGELAAEQRGYLEIILKNANELKAMVGDLLEVSRAEAGKLVFDPWRTSLAPVIDEAIKTLRPAGEAKNVNLCVDVATKLPPVWADPGGTRQVLINLIDNAIKFTSEKGMVTVHAQVSDQEPEFVRVAVVDTGIGITPENQARIFERLFQESNGLQTGLKGIGLGLFIAKELVSRQGGRIWVQSQLGLGCTFFFTLPIFSIPRLCAPIFTLQNMHAGSLVLLTVELSPADKRLLSESDVGVRQEFRTVLGRCILPALDVLLPRIVRSKSAELDFIVACTDRKGAEVMVRRIREQVALVDSLKAANLETAISVEVVELPRNNQPFEELVRYASKRIEELVETGISKRGLIPSPERSSA